MILKHSRRSSQRNQTSANMPQSKTPGQSNAASDKLNKADAEGTYLFLRFPSSHPSSSVSHSPSPFPTPTPNLPSPFALLTLGLTHPNRQRPRRAQCAAAKQHPKPGEAPVTSDSGNSNVGVSSSANNPGKKGIGGVIYGSR